MSMVNSMVVENDDVSESVVDGLIDEFGDVLPSFFDVTIIVTVVVDPLPEATVKERILSNDA
ncbi:MAG: hypothetical protein ACYSW3_27045 [Planctomycetota bacterium]|jgi:hypothetical protein